MKVRALGASMLRGNATNFYIRCDADLDDQDTDAYRADEYPHIHVNTDGPYAHNNILYIGITYGAGGGNNVAIYMNGQHQMDIESTIAEIKARCPRISADRVHPLAQYLHGYSVQVCHQ